MTKFDEPITIIVSMEQSLWKTWSWWWKLWLWLRWSGLKWWWRWWQWWWQWWRRANYNHRLNGAITPEEQLWKRLEPLSIKSSFTGFAFLRRRLRWKVQMSLYIIICHSPLCSTQDHINSMTTSAFFGQLVRETNIYRETKPFFKSWEGLQLSKSFTRSCSQHVRTPKVGLKEGWQVLALAGC